METSSLIVHTSYKPTLSLCFWRSRVAPTTLLQPLAISDISTLESPLQLMPSPSSPMTMPKDSSTEDCLTIYAIDALLCP